MDKYAIKIWAVFDEEELVAMKRDPAETCITIMEDLIKEGGMEHTFRVMECEKVG